MRWFLAGLIAAVVALGSVRHAEAAQHADGGLTGAVARPDIQVESLPDGWLNVSASAPLVDVIRAVASAAGHDMLTIGEPPAEHVTVAFTRRHADDILRELMEPAGVSYLISAGPDGRRGRLFMGRLPAGSPPLAQAIAAATAAAASKLNPVRPGDGTPIDPQAPRITQGDGPTEWPAGIEPASSAASSSMPRTWEELLDAVHGSTPVSMPLSAVPWYHPAPATPAAGSATPGAPTAAAPMVAKPADGAGAVGPHVVVDPSTIPVPVTVAVPAPFVIEFPAPPPH